MCHGYLSILANNPLDSSTLHYTQLNWDRRCFSRTFFLPFPLSSPGPVASETKARLSLRLPQVGIWFQFCHTGRKETLGDSPEIVCGNLMSSSLASCEACEQVLFCCEKMRQKRCKKTREYFGSRFEGPAPHGRGEMAGGACSPGHTAPPVREHRVVHAGAQRVFSFS